MDPQPNGTPTSPNGERNPVWAFITEKTNLTLPDFSTFTPEALSAAAEAAVTFQVHALDDVVESAEAPTFLNTTLAVEHAINPVERLWPIIRLYESALSTPDTRQPLADISALLKRAQVNMYLDSELFHRLEAVPTAQLNPEDRRHHELLIADFVHAGARLDSADRARVAELQQEISMLETEFGQFVQQESQDSALHITPGSGLSVAGLSQAEVDSAIAEATARGVDGYVLALQSTTNQPSLESLTDPDTRTALFNASILRGCRGNNTDTRGVVTDITALRAGLAQVMGYRSFSEYQLSQNMAANPTRATGLLMQVLEPALAQLRTELDTVRHTYAPDRLEREDISFYLARYAKDHFGIDAGEVAHFFEFTRVLEDGVMYAATQLYGVRFERTELVAWHPDVTVYRAFEGQRELGLICVDPYARATKRGGAWMDQLVPFARLTGERPIITMTMNVPKPSAGNPTLLNIDSVITAFHEFGHVLHGLFANSTYPTRSGTSVPRDYVEFPSQLNEMWALHPQVLPNYAVHVHTGESMPQELAHRLVQAAKFGQGFATVEYLAAALVDLGWHALEAGDTVEAVTEFEQAVLESAGFDPLVPPRYSSPFFQHTFSFGYATSYYAYLWSEQLAAFVTEWFDAQGGLVADAGDAFRQTVLAPGFSVDPKTAILELFGQEPTVSPLLRKRGLAD